MSDSFADVLRRCRRARGLSQGALAEAAGMSSSAISALERGVRRSPYPHTLWTLAEAMALSDADRQALVAAAGTGSRSPIAHELAGSVIPAPLTSFVGREGLVTLGTGLLARERLITITGLAGVGKTRLALELGRRAAGLLPGGCWTIDVESLAAAASVSEHAAAVLGLRDSTDADHIDSLARSIGDLACLLTLDGCEHRTRECAELASRLLAACPGLVLLATSQRPLAVRGEVVLSVPPLTVPKVGEGSAVQSEAVRLFVARAQLADPGRDLANDEQLGAISELCRQLDGIPLAIELAAARVRVLPVTEMIVRMQDRFELLRGEGNLPARKRAIHAALQWSCDLLTPAERQLLGRLSVFVGGFTLHAVEGGPGRDMSQVLRLMTTLVDASLVAADISHGAVGRYRLLDTVRAYASQLLAMTPVGDTVRSAHADYYLQLAERWEPELRGPDQAQVLRRLDEEYENLRVVLCYWAACPEREPLVRLVTALAPYWVRRGRFHDGQQWLRIVFDGSPPEAIPLAAFEAASDLCWITGDVAAHRRAARRYLDHATAAGNLVHQARATLYVSSTYLAEGDQQTWLTLAKSAKELAEQAGDPWTLAMVLNDSGAGTVLNDITAGRVAVKPAALRQLREAVRLARSTGDLYLIALGLDSLAYAEARSGLTHDALRHWSACLLDLGGVIDPATAATCVEGLAQLAHLSALDEQCLSLLSASAAHRGRHDVPPSPVWSEIIAGTATSARATLSTETAVSAEKFGADLAWDEAIHLALGLTERTVPST